MRTNGKYGNLDQILHRTESSDRVAAVMGLENHPIISMLSGHRDQDQKKKERKIPFSKEPWPGTFL